MTSSQPLPPQIPKIDPLESGIEFFEEQKKFTFLLRYQCNKVFLNHVDSYNGRHILRYIGTREFVKPEVYPEIHGEGSMPTLIGGPPPSSNSSLVSDEESEGRKETPTVASAPAAPRPVSQGPAVPPREQVLLPEAFAGEAARDSLFSILGGLLNKEQLGKLRSLPTKTQRAEYLRNIFNQMVTEPELVAEEPAEPSCYEMAGTLKYCDECLPEIQIFLKERVRDVKAYLPTLLSCATVIFDISRDPSQIEEARWALRAILCSFQYLEGKSALCFRQIKDVRKFILISSAMTWENTDKMKVRKKPVNEENLPLRKPHPLFKEHKHLEQEVIRAGLKYRDVFKTYVLASGIPYGCEEDRFNYLFDLAWRNEEEIPLLGIGHNALPIIHVEDLAMLVFHCLSRIDDSPTYMFAVEKDPPTLLQITESVSRGLTTGKTRSYSLDEQLPDNLRLHEDTFAMMTSELLLEPLVHKLTLPWKHSSNMVNNMATIIDEYIEHRNLCPFKIIVSGAPTSGKTNLALRLAEIYDVKYIHIQEVVRKYIEYLENEAQEQAKNMDIMKPEGNEEDKSDEDYVAGAEEEKIEDMAEGDTDKMDFSNELDEIKHSMEVNGGIPEDSIAIRILKKRLEEMDVLNHGYVLDGWPETATQAHGMFGRDEEAEEMPSPEMSEEEEDQEAPNDTDEDIFGEDMQQDTLVRRNINIQPNFLIQLDCEIDELIFRYLAAKEDLEMKNPSSERFSQRMDQYKEIDKIGCRAFDYFDNNFLDLRVLRFNIKADPCPHLGQTLKRILDSLGPPTNTGFLRRYLEEYKMIRKRHELEAAKKFKERADGIEKMDIEYFKAACQFMDKWVDFRDKVIKEKSECVGLNDELLPESVLEMVVRALVNFKQTSPDNYLEFLAEFFLREYEKEKGSVVLPTSGAVSANLCDGAVAFRRCVASVLKHCDPACMPLLPQAVDVILKYRRFATARGATFPPQACQEQPQAEDTGSEETKLGAGDKFHKTEQTKSSAVSMYTYMDGEQQSFSNKSLSSMSLSRLVDLLVKTNPIWTEKIRSDTTGKKLTITDESLKLLLDQLRQLSCEIRYRLRKRGVMQMDDVSSVGSVGIWPRSGSEVECSGEVRPQQQSSAPSINTKQNLEKIKLYGTSTGPFSSNNDEVGGEGTDVEGPDGDAFALDKRQHGSDASRSKDGQSYDSRSQNIDSSSFLSGKKPSIETADFQ